MSLMPGKAHVDTTLASLRVLLFFLVRGAKKTAWRRSARHGLAWSTGCAPETGTRSPGMPVEDSFRLCGDWKNGAR